MERTGMQDVYEHHHTVGNRQGVAIFRNERSKFLRDRIGEGKRVLDIGCRDGTLTKLYAEGNKVLGLDIDAQALATAQRELGIETKHVDLNGPWDVEPNAFDVVVAGEVLEHLYYPDRVLEKVADALKPGGIFLGTVPNAFTLKNRLRLLMGIKHNTPLADPTHINQFTYHEVKQLMERHFTDVHLHSFGRYSALDRITPGMFAFMIMFEGRKGGEVTQQQ